MSSTELLALQKEYNWTKERFNDHKQQRLIHLTDVHECDTKLGHLSGLLNDSVGFWTYVRPEYIQIRERRNRQAEFANECAKWMDIRSERMNQINKQIQRIYF